MVMLTTKHFYCVQWPEVLNSVWILWDTQKTGGRTPLCERKSEL